MTVFSGEKSLRYLQQATLSLIRGRRAFEVYLLKTRSDRVRMPAMMMVARKEWGPEEVRRNLRKDPQSEQGYYWWFVDQSRPCTKSIKYI